MQRSALKQITALMLPLCFAGCQSSPATQETAVATTAAVTTSGQGHFLSCYLLDPASEVRLLVYKEGPLARVGHNHVMVSHGLTGSLALHDPSSESRLRVVLPVASLEVDPPALRLEEGTQFASDVSDEARAGTTTNMLSENVLNADVFPDIVVELVSLQGPMWSADATLRLQLTGQTREQSVAVSLRQESDVITATSSFSISQSAFGLTPFSVLGGGLRVADEVKIRVNLQFNRSTAEQCQQLPSS